MKKIKQIIITLLTVAILPLNTFAYSDYIIASGENIGIELNSKGIIIVGTYDVDGSSPAKKANLQQGDKIIKINDKEVNTIEEMMEIINENNNIEEIKITYLRGSKVNTTNLEMKKDENDVYKTGLYIKDNITGIGTLTFIDPKTKLYGALGHEIVEKNTGQKLEIKDGKIYSSTVTGITPSDEYNPGEKNARYDSTDIHGYVKENTTSGIFGEYTSEIKDIKKYKVATYKDIKLKEAKILTVLEDNKVEGFNINILKVSDESNSTKNILFEVTDKKLLEKAGGIVQGMSGSPIVQGEYIIGAVTHVVVDDPKKGYGILITTMLEEAEN